MWVLSPLTALGISPESRLLLSDLLYFQTLGKPPETVIREQLVREQSHYSRVILIKEQSVLQRMESSRVVLLIN